MNFPHNCSATNYWLNRFSRLNYEGGVQKKNRYMYIKREVLKTLNVAQPDFPLDFPPLLFAFSFLHAGRLVQSVLGHFALLSANLFG